MIVPPINRLPIGLRFLYANTPMISQPFGKIASNPLLSSTLKNALLWRFTIFANMLFRNPVIRRKNLTDFISLAFIFQADKSFSRERLRHSTTKYVMKIKSGLCGLSMGEAHNDRSIFISPHHHD